MSPNRATLSLLAVTVLASAAGAQGTAPAPSARDLQVARRALRAAPLIDGHNDLPWAIREAKGAPMDVEAYDLTKQTPGHTDLPRLRRGLVGGQFWSIYIPGEIRDSGYARVQLEQFDIAKRVIAKYPKDLAFAWTAADVRRAHRAGKVASMLGLEGGHAIENSLGALRAYRELGARYMTLTHNVTLDWADAALDSAKHGGLTAFGKEVVREMNRLGMLVDLAHVSPATMSDALDVSEAPVIFSHSGARAVVDVARNVPDSILRRLPKNGGVVMVPFVPGFTAKAVLEWEEAADKARAEAVAKGADEASLRQMIQEYRRAHPMPRATIADVADHIEHVRRVAGIDHVGIGGDFDGISTTPVGLEDVSTYPALFAELARRGWTQAELEQLAGRNVLRVMEQAERVAARLQKERAPSTKTIAELDHPAP
ncbi:MAG TPA: dipeptidase [Gemmatimonadaceae bacterium]